MVRLNSQRGGGLILVKFLVFKCGFGVFRESATPLRNSANHWIWQGKKAYNEFDEIRWTFPQFSHL